jgi:hypothetical protein
MNPMRAGLVLNNATMGVYLANDTLGGFNCSGAASPLTLTSGRGHVNGRDVLSTASTGITVDTPAASTRKDLLVLQYDKSTNQVLPYVHQGVEGAGAYPSVTQTANVWEVAIWGITITTMGAITLEDKRVPVELAIQVSDANLPDGTLDRDKLEVLARRVMIMPFLAWNVTDNVVVPAEYQDYGAPMPDSKVTDVIAVCQVPSDWNRDADLEIIPVVMTAAAAAANLYYSLSAKWGDESGEDYNTHTAANALAAEAIEAGPKQTFLTALEIPAATADDDHQVLTITLKRDATDPLDTVGAKVYLRGFLLYYNSK